MQQSMHKRIPTSEQAIIQEIEYRVIPSLNNILLFLTFIYVKM